MHGLGRLAAWPVSGRATRFEALSPRTRYGRSGRADAGRPAEEGGMVWSGPHDPSPYAERR